MTVCLSWVFLCSGHCFDCGVALRAGLSCKSTEPQERLRPSGFHPMTLGGEGAAGGQGNGPCGFIAGGLS